MKKAVLFLLILNLFVLVSAQTRIKKNTRPAAKTSAPEKSPSPVPTATPEPENAPPEKVPTKKNARDAAGKNAAADAPKLEDAKDYYRYEFSQPNFLTKKIIIEHDENGRGKITFEEKNFEDSVTEKIQLSPVSLEKIKKSFAALNFLDSTEEYQSTVRNYGHLGAKKIVFKTGGKERSAEFNWTENADAKALGDEYSKIGYQLVWESDIKAARENQPLQTPSLVQVLDSYLRRNEISDPQQMLPFLKELSGDERLPLLARNHVLRLIKNIEKSAEKK